MSTPLNKTTKHKNISVVSPYIDNETCCILLTPTGRDLLEMVVSRGLNCWDRAPAELKELGDILTSGQIQQDYP